MQDQGVQDTVNINKIKFELYGNLVDQAFSQFNETFINNQDPLHNQTENDETSGAEYPNEKSELSMSKVTFLWYQVIYGQILIQV